MKVLNAGVPSESDSALYRFIQRVRSIPAEPGRYNPNEAVRAKAVIWVNLACVIAWAIINLAATLWLGDLRPLGVAGAGLAMAMSWFAALRQISLGRMALGIAAYTVSGLALLLVMGIFVPELSLLFAFATFIFLAFGLSYMSGRASFQVVLLTIAVALALLVTSEGLRWRSGVPDHIFRWINLIGMLMALLIDATMFSMLRRTLEERAGMLVDAEREAAKLQNRLAQQERLDSIGKLAGGVAHDFNNLLGIILNYCVFISEAVEDRPDVKRDVEEVQTAAQRAVALTRQLLIFGKRSNTHGDVVDINHVIADSESLLRSVVGEHIAISTDLAQGLPLVQMDSTRIEQILLNLSLNSRDAMPGGGLLLIETSERYFQDNAADPMLPEPGHYVCVSVTDNGTGFTEEALHRAYEPFFTTKPTGRGTGLGLSTVYGIVTDANGTVQIYSEPGIGTTVRVLIPTAADQQHHTSGDLSDSGLSASGDGLSILLVEDEPQLRHITTRLLERAGFSVFAPDGAYDALAILQGGQEFDLLLTDVVMPGLSGIDLVKRAKVLRPSMICLMMSGFPRGIWETSDFIPDAEILEKPFDASHLLARIAQVLGQRDG